MSADQNTAARHNLELALSEAQATVRAYDTKAQIVGIGYTFAINIVANVFPEFPMPDDVAIMPVIVFWGLIMVPLFLFGFVLYPTRKIAPQLSGNVGPSLQRVLYIETERFGSVKDLEAAALGANWTQELAFEILKVSRLRELKRGRFIRALFAAALSFLVLALGQVWTVLH